MGKIGGKREVRTQKKKNAVATTVVPATEWTEIKTIAELFR